MKIRLKFQKKGNLKFIGHLDVMRTFQKINRRAGIDIKYSAGFSPHQQMSFSNPLSLGMTSSAEYVDYEMNSVPGKEELIDLLNRVNVEELKILDACLLPEDAKNCMSILKAADYTLNFREGHLPDDKELFLKKLREFMALSSIPVTKKTKKGTREIDLKDQILDQKIEDDRIFLSLDAGSGTYCHPNFVLETFCDMYGFTFDPLMFQINRDELYGEEEGKLKPLIEYGTDF